MKNNMKVLLGFIFLAMLSGCKILEMWRGKALKEDLVLKETESSKTSKDTSGEYYSTETYKTDTDETSQTKSEALISEIADINAFDDKVLDSKIPVVVKLETDWCPKCKIMNPIYEKIASDNSEILFLKANLDKVPEITVKYNIRGVPCFLFFVNGEKKGEILGTVTPDDFESRMKTFFE